jgi:hypothetical protein
MVFDGCNGKVGVIRVTDIQKQTVAEMRRQGTPHADIAGAVGLRESAIKSYCWRHNIKPGQPVSPKSNADHCQNCGQRVASTLKTLYEDRVASHIDIEEYKRHKTDYDHEQSLIKEQLLRLRKELEQLNEVTGGI